MKKTMKRNAKSYLMELITVTTGVLIALFLSNLKESNQARNYYKASIETINNEIEANYSELKGIIEKQMKFQDTLNQYRDSSILIGEIFDKSSGLQVAELSNSGLDIYKRNQISSIDFEMISTLNDMINLSDIIDAKLNRLTNFIYPNILNNSKESKLILSVHMQDVLGSEIDLMKRYKNYIDKNIDTENIEK